MLNDFYDSESKPIVSFEAFYGPKKHLIDKCLITFSKAIYDWLLENHECRRIAEIGACNGNIPVWAFDNGGEEIAFYLTGIGPALAAADVAEVNHLTGANRFIAFGSCGSLDADKTRGKFIVPTQAYRGEGLSFYFAPPADYIDVKNHAKVAEFFAANSIPFVEGRVWTTECMLRETVNLVNARRQEGCIAVEMEISAVQSLCDYYGIELYYFLAAGDVLAEDNYDTTELGNANHNIDKLQLALALAKAI